MIIRMTNLPEWLTLWIWASLRGEIYPEMRMIVAAFEPKSKILTMRYYLTRSPTDDDYERADIIGTLILSNASGEIEVANVVNECVSDDRPLGQLELLEEVMFARHEHWPN